MSEQNKELSEQESTSEEVQAQPEAAHQAKKFDSFALAPSLVSALAKRGIEDAFPIQEFALPVALNGQDIIGQARTGTGKTLAFGLPTIHRVLERLTEDPQSKGTTSALVVVPTRELALQVKDDLSAAAAESPVRITAIYGGVAYEPQVKALQEGSEVVVGTPGRLLDLIGQRQLSLSGIKTIVLDEADEMLNLGFLPDIERIFTYTPSVRQTMLFSATMPGPIVTLARRYMTKALHIQAEDPSDTAISAKSIRQLVYRAHSLDKHAVVSKILQARNRGRTIIFTKTKRTADSLTKELRSRGFKADAIHGDLGQKAREKALDSFRKGTSDVLVATDVAARGIDVEEVTHVINYECPDEEATYLHRIGRTGRAGNTGTAVTFVDWEDVPRWTLIDKALDNICAEPVETYSTSPHLFTDLDIPEDAKASIGAPQTQPKRSPSKKPQNAKQQNSNGDSDAAPRRKRTRRRTYSNKNHSTAETES